MTPVVRARRAVGERRSVVRATCMIKPSRNDPRTLTASVPQGKPGPATRSSQPESRYRAPVPAAPPRQIQRKRAMGRDSTGSLHPGAVVRSLAAVFLLTKPAPKRIERFFALQRNRTFSYREVGHTRKGEPPGYQVDHNRVQIGEGRAAFARAVEAMRNWKMFDLGWVSAHPTTAPIVPGSTVVIRMRHFGFWSLNACRIA